MAVGFEWSWLRSVATAGKVRRTPETERYIRLLTWTALITVISYGVLYILGFTRYRATQSAAYTKPLSNTLLSGFVYELKRHAIRYTKDTESNRSASCAVFVHRTSLARQDSNLHLRLCTV